MKNFQNILLQRANFIYAFLFYFFFYLILSFGVYVRVQDIKFWDQNKTLFFYKEEPLFSEFDSFYFARLAKDLEEGIYQRGKIDPFRFFPDNSSTAKLSEEEDFAPRYGISGNFISYLFYYLHRISGLSVAKLTWYLIPFLAITVAIPLVWYLKKIGLPLAGLTGGLVTVVAPMYLGRTNLMRLDHDVLNLTLPFTVAFLFYLYFQAKTLRQKLSFASLASLGLLFYQLWYGHPNLCFVLILTFLFYFFWEKKFRIKDFSSLDWLTLAILILPQIWYIYQGPYHLYLQVKTLVFGLKHQTSAERLFADFPNIFHSISELQKLSPKDVFSTATYSFFFGVMGLIGGLLLFLFHWKNLFFLLPFFGIGLLTFVSGARFAMYLSPFVGLGIGYLVHLLFEKFFPMLDLFKEENKRNLTVSLVGSLILLVLFFISKEAISLNSTPKIHALLVKDMEWIKFNTPKEAVIWSWWDYGYAFQLYARRATVHDGGSQTSPKTYLVARSFATYDPQEAWRIISFTANYGLTGLTKLLKNGKSAPELMKEIQQGLYEKPINTPIYIVFTDDLIAKFGWIHYFGSFDFKKKEGEFGRILTPQQCKFVNPQVSTNLIQCADLENAILDLANGIISIKNGTAPIKTLFYHYGKELKVKNFFEVGWVVELLRNKEGQLGLFLLPTPQENTLFNRMFLLRQYDPNYFELVYDNFPVSVIYRVKTK